MRRFMQSICVMCISVMSAEAQNVGVFWRNDKTAKTLSFNDAFGHQVVVGTYDSLTGTWNSNMNSQPQNLFFMSPDGTSGVPLFRAPVSADFPTSLTLKSIAVPAVTQTWAGNANNKVGLSFDLTSASASATVPEISGVFRMLANKGSASVFPANTAYKMALGIETVAVPGAGNSYAAYSVFTGASGVGNFSQNNLVLSMTNNNQDYPFVIGQPLSAILQMATSSAFPSTAFIFGSDSGSTTFGARYGAFFYGVKTVKDVTFRDDTNSSVSFQANGSHIDGISTSSGTFSGKQFIGTGWSVDPSGNEVANSVGSVGAVTAFSGTSVPSGGTTGSGLKMSSVSNLGMFFGSGAPALSAALGSIYLQNNNFGRPYFNTDGSASWAAVPMVLSAQNGGDTNNSNSGSGSDLDHNLTFTIPANFITSGRVFRVTAHYRLTTGSGPPLLTHRIKLGSVVLLASDAVVPGASLTNVQTAFQWIFQATQAPGAAANVECGATGSLNSVGAAGVGRTAMPVAIATNAAQVAKVSTQWSAAGTGTNTIALSQFIVEVLN